MRFAYSILFATLFLCVSCEEGKFTEEDLGIRLTFPADNIACETGTHIPSEGLFEIELKFTLKGQIAIESLELIIDGIREESFNPVFNEDESEYIFKRKFSYSDKTYKWQIKSSDGSIESPTFSFTTPQQAFNNNTAPYPVVFDKPAQFVTNTNGTQLTVTWQTEDVDANDNVDLKFDAYYYVDEKVSTQLFAGQPQIGLTDKRVSFDIPNTDYSPNQFYYILIVAKDLSGNESYSRDRFCQLCNQ